jgi:hypothetical protein
VLGGFSFFIGAKLFQDPAVLSKLVINVPHNVVRIRIEPVIEAVPAHIGAKLFVDPARKRFTAFLAIHHILFVSPEPLAARTVCIYFPELQYSEIHLRRPSARIFPFANGCKCFHMTING